MLNDSSDPDDMNVCTHSRSVATILKSSFVDLHDLSLLLNTLVTMPPKQTTPVQLPSFHEARRVFTGNRGGEGNLAAAGSVSTAVREVQRTGLFSSWIRPQSIQQLKQRAIANTHEE